MKKLIIIYALSIAMIFTLPVMLSRIGDKKPQKLSPNALPKEINVFFVDEGVTKPIDFEEYLKGVLPAEVPALFHVEALKAQAVAARTYAYYKYAKFTKDPGIAPAEHKDATVCTKPAHCNAFYTKEKLLEIHGQEWMDKYYKKYCDAVDDTRGEILVYEEQPILAVFHSASAGGMTENCKDVWGGDLPYLVSVKSEGEEKRDGFVTTVIVPAEDLKNKIKQNYESADFPKDKAKWVGDIVKTEGGAVGTVKIGGVDIKGVKMREIFGLRSAHFQIKKDNDNFVFTVEGYGHGVGMSQYGANYMAQNGSKYDQILQSYYKNTVLKK